MPINNVVNWVNNAQTNVVNQVVPQVVQLAVPPGYYYSNGYFYPYQPAYQPGHLPGYIPAPVPGYVPAIPPPGSVPPPIPGYIPPPLPGYTAVAIPAPPPPPGYVLAPAPPGYVLAPPPGYVPAPPPGFVPAPGQPIPAPGWDQYQQKEKALIEGSQVMVDGTSYIIGSVTGDLVINVNTGKRKAIILAMSLIAIHNCTQSVFDDAKQIMDRASDVIFWLAASNFTYQEDVACRELLTSYDNAKYYLESCVNSTDLVYKDAGKLIGETRQVIDRMCTDKEYQNKFHICGCSCNCTKKNEPMLRSIGLLDDDEGIGVRTFHPKPNIQQVCSATQKLSKCAKQEHCEETGRVETILSKSVGYFCKRHISWEPARGSAVIPTDAPLNAPKEATTKAGTASLEAAFHYYLSLIISILI